MSRSSFIESVSGLPRRVSVRQIVMDVAKLHGVSASEVLGPNRQRKFVIPRQEAMRRAYQAGASLNQIGRVMSRDHTTILHGVRQADRRLNQNEISEVRA